MELIWVAVISKSTGAPAMMTPAGRAYYQQDKVSCNVIAGISGNSGKEILLLG